MKTFLVAALVLVPCLAWADSTNAPATSSTTSSELAGLTPEQQKAAQQFLATEAKKRKAIEDNKSMQPQQKEVEISTLHRDTLIQIQSLKMSRPAPAHP